MEISYLCCIVLVFSIGLVHCHCQCPCSDPSLCQPITDTARKEIFVFSVQNNASSWEKFDWQKLTTVVTVGYVSTDLMCLAHQQGARVVIIANYQLSELTYATVRTEWVKYQLAAVTQNYYDGINIDFEAPILKNQTNLRDAFTALVKETYQTFKQANPHYQVTVDTAWGPNCVDQRCYDNKGLAQNTDFLFVMAYDEQSQIIAEHCSAKANSPLNKTMQGLRDYLSLGIQPDQLVLGVPWYGYNYPCLSLSQDNLCTIKPSPFRGVRCSDAAGSQIDYKIIYPLLMNHSAGGRHWDQSAQSPFFNYKDQTTDQMHQVRYDDPESLTIKYKAAQSLGLRGVGTWNIDCLDFSDKPYAVQQTKKMFDAFPTYPH